jgi:class 3 adenylate cyclase
MLAEHHRVLRAVWARHGGVEVHTAGDAFFVAFARATDAVAAAGDAQVAARRLEENLEREDYLAANRLLAEGVLRPSACRASDSKHLRADFRRPA